MTVRTGGADARGAGLGEAAQAEQHGGPPEGHPFVTVCRVSRCCWERAGVMRTWLIWVVCYLQKDRMGRNNRDHAFRFSWFINVETQPNEKRNPFYMMTIYSKNLIWAGPFCTVRLISFIYPSVCCLVTQWQKALCHLHRWAFSLLWSSVTYVCPTPVNSALVTISEYVLPMNTRPRRVPTQRATPFIFAELHLKLTSLNLEKTLSWAFSLREFWGHWGFVGRGSSGILLRSVSKESWGERRE